MTSMLLCSTTNQHALAAAQARALAAALAYLTIIRCCCELHFTWALGRNLRIGPSFRVTCPVIVRFDYHRVLVRCHVTQRNAKCDDSKLRTSKWRTSAPERCARACRHQPSLWNG